MNEVIQEDSSYNDCLKKKKRRQFREQLPFYFMMLPGLIYLFCNNYLPMFGIVIAFKKVNFAKGIWNSPWCGLENFKFLFATKDAYIMIRNTVCYNLAWIAIGTIIAIAIALMMNEIAKKPIAKFLQPVICFPSMISAVILSYLVYAFLSTSNGFLNRTIFASSPISWYSEPKYWPIILTIVYLWQNAGQSSIIYMAAIAGIDKGLYEAARLDGANKWKQITTITLPLIRQMVILMLLMSIGRIFNSDFGLFYQVPLNSGMLYSTTQTIDTYVYRALLEMNNVGMSSAASVFQAVIGFVLVLTSNMIVSKVDSESALF
ncbi:MAG: ABC transporter permease subunit [Solobacterium sp.]|nr:ABC transporter permease subunit [Solobacterium sp.]